MVAHLIESSLRLAGGHHASRVTAPTIFWLVLATPGEEERIMESRKKLLEEVSELALQNDMNYGG